MSSSSAPKKEMWRLPPTESDGDSFYINDCRKIQENIRMIQNSAMVASKLCGIAEGAPSKSEAEIFSMIGGAKNAAIETQGLLRHLREYVQVSRPDRAQRQLMYTKLSNGFQEALKSLEVTVSSQVLREHLRNAEGNDGGVGSLATTRRPISGRSGSVGYSSYTSSNYDFASGGSLEYKPIEEQASSNDPGSCYHMDSGHMTYQELAQKRTQPSPEGFSIWSSDLEQEILRERDAGIIQIKKDIEGIQRLYKEMAFYVNCRGGDLDSIESQMRDAAEHSARATGEVTRARSYQTSRLRTMLIFLLVLASLMACLFIFTRGTA